MSAQVPPDQVPAVVYDQLGVLGLQLVVSSLADNCGLLANVRKFGYGPDGQRIYSPLPYRQIKIEQLASLQPALIKQFVDVRLDIESFLAAYLQATGEA